LPDIDCLYNMSRFWTLINLNTLVCQVEDLHSITPNHFLEVSGAVIHPLSYQQVKFHNMELNFHIYCGQGKLFPLFWNSLRFFGL
jgi:hypothetical protein